VATSLSRAPIGIELRVVEAAGPTALTRRLSELGLRVGSHVRCVQKTAGGGRIVDVAGARIALGRDVLAVLQTVVVSDSVSGAVATTP
jgi:ferrous iron transport protein A